MRSISMTSLHAKADVPAVITASLPQVPSQPSSSRPVVGDNRDVGGTSSYHVRDVWGNKTYEMTYSGVINATVLPHEAKLLRVWLAN